jgi:hypothetical protein
MPMPSATMTGIEARKASTATANRQAQTGGGAARDDTPRRCGDVDRGHGVLLERHEDSSRDSHPTLGRESRMRILFRIYLR